MKAFLNRYITKTFIVVVACEMLLILLALIQNKFSTPNFDIVLDILLIGSLILHAITWIVGMVFLIIAGGNDSFKKSYIWSIVFVLGSIIECIVVFSNMPMC